MLSKKELRAKIDDILSKELTPEEFGRVQAITVKPSIEDMKEINEKKALDAEQLRLEKAKQTSNDLKAVSVLFANLGVDMAPILDNAFILSVAQFYWRTGKITDKQKAGALSTLRGIEAKRKALVTPKDNES